MINRNYQHLTRPDLDARALRPEVKSGLGGILRVVCTMSLVVGFAVLASGGTNFIVRSPNITVELSREGKIVRVVHEEKKISWSLRGETSLAGCQIEGAVESEEEKNGGVRFKKHLTCQVEGSRKEGWLIDEFQPAKESVRWDIQLKGAGSPWSTAIETRLQIPDAERVKFWTAWGDPRPAHDAAWRDPLVLSSLSDRKFWYGTPYYQYGESWGVYTANFGDVFCIPLVSLVERKGDIGFSLALSPADVLLDLTLETSAKGDVSLSRLFRRISEESATHFQLDLVAHEADWRGGLRWMTSHYPDYFYSPLETAGELGGTAAYSSYEGNVDVEKLKRMGFRVNWITGLEMPYMGMFLPPVQNDNEQWPSFGLSVGYTSVRQMAAYARWFHERGFYLLNYFNVEGFGSNILFPPPTRKSESDSDLWKDPNDFLHAKLADAILYYPKRGRPFMAKFAGRWVSPDDPWPDGGIGSPRAMLDCGEPTYQDFLLTQARRLIDKIPDASGICIDRLDWLGVYNFRRDDNVSWYDGPARALISSWKDLLEKLGPLEHKAGKVIFVNNHHNRIDILRQVDGLFDEFGYDPASMNTTGLTGLFKPTLCWVASEGDLRPNPDGFLQKYLYMGVFPMAPFPGNHHAIVPSAWADQQYLDYGPLFEAMRGRKWVLVPHAIAVEGDAAKANLFQVQTGYVIPVTFGGSTSNASVTIRGIPEILAGKKMSCELIHPGDKQWQACESAGSNHAISLSVSLRRGCALVRLRSGDSGG